jgi:hypothetical protein
MDTTRLQVERLEENAEAIHQRLRGEPGIGRVLVRPDRGVVYIRHSRAKMPRERILEIVAESGLEARILGR